MHICNASFARNYDLKRHALLIHEENKPFKCTICDAWFSEEGTLKKHVSSIHERKQPCNAKLVT